MAKPIRVLMLLLDYYPRTGGAQQQLKMQVPYLRELGLDVHVVTRHFDDLPRKEIIDGVPVYRLSYKGPKAAASFQFMLGALQKIRELRPDVIHAYSFLSPLRTAVLAKRLYGIPVVVKILRSGDIGDVQRMQKRPLAGFYNQTYRHWVDRFIVISSEVEDELNQIGIPAEKQIFIPNGVNLDRFAPISEIEKKELRQRLGIEVSKTTAVYTGRLVPEKCVDLLIRSWNRLVETNPNVHLYILGDGEDREMLERMAGPQISFTGRVDNVLEYLQAADLFVLPSSVEGLSNAMLEGMAAGLPGIVTHVGGAPDVIQSGENGILIEKNNEIALFDALVQMVNDADCRKKLGDRARVKIEELYNLARIPSQFRDMYAEVIK